MGLIKPIEWVPFVLPHQIFRIGQLIIVAVPGEFTTMSGRRLKLTIKQALQDAVREQRFFLRMIVVVVLDLLLNLKIVAEMVSFFIYLNLIIGHLDIRQSYRYRWSCQ